MVGAQVESGPDAAVSRMEDTAMKPCKDGLALFTPKQIEIIQYSARGMRAKEIADALKINRWTVQSHIREIYRAGRIHSMAHAVATLYGTD